MIKSIAQKVQEITNINGKQLTQEPRVVLMFQAIGLRNGIKIKENGKSVTYGFQQFQQFQQFQLLIHGITVVQMVQLTLRTVLLCRSRFHPWLD